MPNTVTISHAVHRVRAQHGANLDFIFYGEERSVPELPFTTLPAWLDAVVASAPGYRWNRVGGRPVLYPRDAVWDSVVSNIDVKDLPRLDAAAEYLKQAAKQLPALAGVLPPPMLGDPRHPLFSDRISIAPAAAVVEHLVQLLGTDERAVFSIDRARSGRLMLMFDLV